MLRSISLACLATAAALAAPGLAGATTFCVNNPAGCSGTAVSSANFESQALQGAHRNDGQPELVVVAPGAYTNSDTFVAGGDDPLELRGSGIGTTTFTSTGTANAQVIRTNNV